MSDLLSVADNGYLELIAGSLVVLLFVAAAWAAWKVVWKALKILSAQHRRQKSLVDLINAELPQTQCGHCGYAGCLPYARAIGAGAAINKCAPGGSRTIRRLSRLLNEQEEPVDPAHGISGPRKIARIREPECIGCTLCIQACPVDAIVGAPKLMHTVLSAECSGCDLCIDPCPVDCIDLVPSAANAAVADREMESVTC